MLDEPWHDEIPPGFTKPSYSNPDLWSPRSQLYAIPSRLLDVSSPVFGHTATQEGDNDLIGKESLALGEEILVVGRVTDSWGRPAAGMLLEIWQANAAGRYRHKNDPRLKPVDPHFTGAGRTLTATDGSYWFRTIKPGAYPWGSDVDAWRAQHIHFSISGRGLSERLITQMLFPGDPLIDRDIIVHNVRDEKAKGLLISRIDWTMSVPERAIAYRFDIVLGGTCGTPTE